MTDDTTVTGAAMPPTLAQQLEALMEQTHASHDALIAAIARLGVELFENDAAVMRALEAVRDGQARRASDIAVVVQTIAARIPYVPPVETVALYAAADQRGGLPAVAQGRAAQAQVGLH